MRVSHRIFPIPLVNRVPTSFIFPAGLKDRERVSVQEQWMNGTYRVISATISFGMGVDKATVRYKANQTLLNRGVTKVMEGIFAF